MNQRKPKSCFCHCNKEATTSQSCDNPEQGGCFIWVCVHLETQDDGPHEAQGETVIAIHNVVGTHIFQVNSLFF